MSARRTTLFAPAEGAPPAAVRRHGARLALAGLALVVFGAALVFAVDRLAHGALLDPARARPGSLAPRLRFLTGVPMIAGWLAFVIGLWRATTGIPPARERRTLLGSIVRLLFATLVLAIALTAIALAIVTISGTTSRP